MLSCFSELEQIHKKLDELLWSHQVALVRFDIRQAREQLSRFHLEIGRHIRFEEKSLLPLYADRGGDAIEGGRVEFYLKEHEKILKLLAGITDELKRVSLPASDDGARFVVAFLEREYPLKTLIEHHDRREHAFLYPFLDQVTTAAEKQDLLESAPTL